MMAQETFDPRVLRVFSRGEAFDAEGFSDLFAAQTIYQFGNSLPALDRNAIRDSTAAFFGMVDALYHDIKTIQTDGDTSFVEMDVRYWRKGGTTVVLPCLDVFRFAPDGLVAELRIGMDAGPVGQAGSIVPALASVFAGKGGAELDRPHPMQRYFKVSDEGRARVAAGFAPKWASAGPGWSLDPQRRAQ